MPPVFTDVPIRPTPSRMPPFTVTPLLPSPEPVGVVITSRPLVTVVPPVNGLSWVRTIVPGPHPEVTVAYSLRPPRFPGRPWSLTLRTEPPGQPIPAMALVVHPRTLPLSVEDGEVVDQFPPSRDGATFRIRPRIPFGSYHARVFADPRANPSELPPIRLRHPEAGGTRV